MGSVGLGGEVRRHGARAESPEEIKGTGSVGTEARGTGNGRGEGHLGRAGSKKMGADEAGAGNIGSEGIGIIIVLS